jgi:hypothetical protein
MLRQEMVKSKMVQSKLVARSLLMRTAFELTARRERALQLEALRPLPELGKGPREVNNLPGRRKRFSSAEFIRSINHKQKPCRHAFKPIDM